MSGSDYQAKIEQMEQNIHKMEETQKYRMKIVDDKLHKMEGTHQRRIEQMEAEIHTLSCENIQLRKQNESQEDQLENLLVNMEKSEVLEDQMQYKGETAQLLREFRRRRVRTLIKSYSLLHQNF